MPAKECLSNQVAAGMRYLSGAFDMHRGDAAMRAFRPKLVRGHGNTIRVRLDAKRTQRGDLDFFPNDPRPLTADFRCYSTQPVFASLPQLRRKIRVLCDFAGNFWTALVVVQPGFCARAWRCGAMQSGKRSPLRRNQCEFEE